MTEEKEEEEDETLNVNSFFQSLAPLGRRKKNNKNKTSSKRSIGSDIQMQTVLSVNYCSK